MKIIGYIVSGYHSLKQSTEIARDYVEGGCDMLEISIPLLKNRETPFLSSLMEEAYLACPNYEAHLAGIRSIAERFPNTALTLLLYQEVALQLGARRLAEFCSECGIHDINSPDLTDAGCIAELRGAGVKLAGLILYDFDEESFRRAREADGFVYVQAFPFEGQSLHEGIEAPAELIRFIRSRGITAPLYCGGGIHSPEHAREILKAGGDGVFLGTSVLTLYDNPQDLRQVIRSFADAVN